MAFVIHIGKSKSVRVLSPKLPEVTGEEMKERLERVFSNSEEWMRMTPGDYEVSGLSPFANLTSHSILIESNEG